MDDMLLNCQRHDYYVIKLTLNVYYVIKLTLNSVCAAPSANTMMITTVIHYQTRAQIR